MSSRRVLVAGGSQGIGLAIASGLKQFGDDVTSLSRRQPDGVDGVDHLPCDLRSPEQITDAVGGWLQAVNGRVDVFIFSAVMYGSQSRHPFIETTVKEWDDAVDVNARGLLLTAQAVLPSMLAQGHGLILNISSDIATAPGPGRVAYAASKSAARAIMIGLAEEVADTGVSVLEVMPTIQVDTPGIRSRRPPSFEPVGYADARIFVSPTLWLMNGNARRHHGTCLLVEADGRLIDPNGEVLHDG